MPAALHSPLGASVGLFLGLLLAPASAAAPQAEPQGGFAPAGLAIELDVARCLASRTQLEEAHEVLLTALQGAPDGEPLTALVQREDARLLELLDLRESYLTGIAAEGEKLRVEVDGKRRALRVTGYVDGVLHFALNRYELEQLDATEVSLRDLSSNWKSAKAGKSEQRAYALRLVGDKSWKSQWPRDEEGHEPLLLDLEGVPDSITRGARVLDLRALEGYLERPLEREEARTAIALHQRLFGGKTPQLEGDDGTRLSNLRNMMRDVLSAAWGLEQLGESLHASSFEVTGSELRLVYDFDKQEELQDWLTDDLHVPHLSMLGLLKTPEESWHRELEKGYLQVLGLHDLRHIVPYRGPMHLRYELQVANLDGDGGMWMCGTILNDNLEKSYLNVYGFGYELQAFDRGHLKSAERDQIFYEVGRDYMVDVDFDKTGLLAVKREDKPELSLLSLQTRKVDHGHVSIGVFTDYLTRYGSFEILGTPDLREMDRFRDEWVIDEMSAMGY